MDKKGYVYILASKPYGTLYIGVTSDLIGRVWDHKHNIIKGFTQKYNVHMLVWYQEFELITDAIYKEKQLKEWHRNWKIRLIKETNPCWKDLYEKIIE